MSVYMIHNIRLIIHTYTYIHVEICIIICNAGLGKGSSSGKSIEETTKEIDEHYNKVFICLSVFQPF